MYRIDSRAARWLVSLDAICLEAPRTLADFGNAPEDVILAVQVVRHAEKPLHDAILLLGHLLAKNQAAERLRVLGRELPPPAKTIDDALRAIGVALDELDGPTEGLKHLAFALRQEFDDWRDLQREVLADLDATGQAAGGQ